MLNNQIFLKLYNLAHQSFLNDQIIIFFAHYFPYLVILLAGVFLLFHHEVLFSSNPLNAFKQKWKEIVLVFFSGIFAWGIAQILKIILHIPRPINISGVEPLLEKTSYAFPSGHATFFMALAFTIFLSHKKVGFVFILFALIIGFFRIVAGVHFPIDILGGFILGILIAFLVKFFYQKRKNNIIN